MPVKFGLRIWPCYSYLAFLKQVQNVCFLTINAKLHVLNGLLHWEDGWYDFFRVFFLFSIFFVMYAIQLQSAHAYESYSSLA